MCLPILDGEYIPVEFGFGMQTNDTAFERGGYYDKPVQILIPRILEPLPQILLDNPMNLLVSPCLSRYLVRRLSNFAAVLCKPVITELVKLQDRGTNSS